VRMIHGRSFVGEDKVARTVRARFQVIGLGLLLCLALAACTPRPPATGQAGQPAATPDPAAAAAAAAQFYQGKTVRVIVGFSAGGGFDVVARLVGRHLSKHIPGNPTVVVENMPGATGIVASNYVYAAAPKDGLTIEMFPEPALQGQLLNAEGVQFDGRNFNWLGSTQVQTQLCMARTDSGISSLQQLLQPGSPQFIVGTTAPGSNTHDFPATLKGALNANIRTVSGYPGTADISLAMDSGEVNGICVPWESIKTTHPDWFTGSPPFATILAQQGKGRHADLPNIPIAEEVAQTEEQKQLIRAASSTLAISKPLALPPGVPAERVAALRLALENTMKDPELLADAESTRTDLSFKPHDQVLAIVREILDTPPSVAQRLKQILESSI